MQSLRILFEQSPTPLVELESDLLRSRGIRLLIKRDDLRTVPGHTAFCGNKWRKLQYNLEAARQEGYEQLLTFGGAYSNHLAAVAEAGRLFGFRTAGIVRGEAHEPLNATLRHARACGMQLRYLDRATFRRKAEPDILDALLRAAGRSYLLPEGGTNGLALQGCAGLARELIDQMPDQPPDYVCVSCGTGGTLAGLIAGLNGRSRAIGFPALKGDFMFQEVAGLLSRHYPEQSFGNWHIEPGYHCGGYARFHRELIDFINGFYLKYHIPLDPIYTGKLLFGLFDLIEKKAFPPGSTIVAVHTGGLQGIAGFNERFGELLIHET